MTERAQSSLKLPNIYNKDSRPVETIYESSDDPRVITSFCFLLLPIVYYVFYYTFSQDLLNAGQIANQHKKVDD